MNSFTMKPLPAGWKYKKLHEVSLEINSGSGFPKIFQGSTTGRFPFAKVGDISRCFRNGDVYLKSAENFIEEDIRHEINGRVFPKNTIAFPKIGEALKNNYRVITGCEMLLDNNVMGVTPNPDFMNHTYLYYFLTTEDFGRFSKATTVPSIRRGEIEGIDIPVPPIEVQESIVAKIEELFSELDNGIAALKTAREQLKIYRQAILKHAFEGKLTAQWRKENQDKLETPEQLLARIQQEREARYQQQLEEWKQAVKEWEASGKHGKKPNRPKKYNPEEMGDEPLESLPKIPDSWKWVSFNELLFSIRGGTTIPPVDVTTNFPILRSSSIRAGNLDLDDIRYIPDNSKIT